MGDTRFLAGSRKLDALLLHARTRFGRGSGAPGGQDTRQDAALAPPRPNLVAPGLRRGCAEAPPVETSSRRTVRAMGRAMGPAAATPSP